MSIANCIRRKIGTEIKNFLCNVLCLNNIIPHKAPNAPPRKANNRSISSGILVLLYTAKCLSQPYMANVSRLIMYMKNKSPITILIFKLNNLYHQPYIALYAEYDSLSNNGQITNSKTSTAAITTIICFIIDQTLPLL